MLQEGIRYRLSQACAANLIDTAKSKSRAGRSDIRSRLHSMGRGYTPCSDGSVSVPATKHNYKYTTVHRGEQVMVSRHATGISAVLTAHCNIAGTETVSLMTLF